LGWNPASPVRLTDKNADGVPDWRQKVSDFSAPREIFYAGKFVPSRGTKTHRQITVAGRTFDIVFLEERCQRADAPGPAVKK
jgi:hypothetical protein